MNDEAILLQVRDGALVGVGTWVYVWLRLDHDRPVLYVGSTAVPPVVRMWLHLNDTDPEIGRMLDRYPDVAHEPLDVLAFPVPESESRVGVKSAVVDGLEERGLLSERYVGDQAALLTDQGPSTDAATGMIEQVVAHLAARSGV